MVTLGRRHFLNWLPGSQTCCCDCLQKTCLARCEVPEVHVKGLVSECLPSIGGARQIVCATCSHKQNSQAQISELPQDTHDLCLPHFHLHHLLQMLKGKTKVTNYTMLTWSTESRQLKKDVSNYADTAWKTDHQAWSGRQRFEDLSSACLQLLLAPRASYTCVSHITHSTTVAENFKIILFYDKIGLSYTCYSSYFYTSYTSYLFLILEEEIAFHKTRNTRKLIHYSLESKVLNSLKGIHLTKEN